jgi:hypothetical protein
MATPTSRDTLKEYCLRNLGKPTIEINVSEDQIDDRIDEALQYYRDYHFDGTKKVFLKHVVTANNISDKYIDIPENIQGVVNVFDIGLSTGSHDMFNIRYQIALNDLYTLAGIDLTHYFMTFYQLEMIEELLVGKAPMRYNRHDNKLYLDMDWNKVQAGEYILVEAYDYMDPEIYTDVYNDRWLLRYTTALIRRQWGHNLTKFGGVRLPGGVELNGADILSEAIREIDELEAEMINSYSPILHDLTG